MTPRRIVVCEAQVPFVEGGAEYHVRELVRQLRAHGFQTELVSIPFKWYPKDEILAHAAAWRLIDLSESNGAPIDLAIGTKFPSYFVRHPKKVAWLIHQYRQAYDQYGTAYSDLTASAEDRRLREVIAEIDRVGLTEARKVFANSQTVAARLLRFNGIRSEPLYHPPPLAGRYRSGPPGDTVLWVGRLDSWKRPGLLLDALPHAPEAKAVFVGRGPDDLDPYCVADRTPEPPAPRPDAH